LLEESFAHFCEFLVLVIAVCIGPFENLTALDNNLAAFLKEIELFRRIALPLVQQDALLPDHGQELDGKFTRAIMVCVSLVVPHIALKFTSGILSFLLLYLETRVFFLLLVQIAFVVAASGRAVALPVTHADPAELVATLRACHVVAPLVLFNVLLALRANFSVGSDPGDVLRFGIGFLVPEAGCRAVARFMRVLTTTEAENCTALALNFVEHAAGILSLAAVLALDIRAPFDVSVVVGEGLAQPLPVGLFVFG